MRNLKLFAGLITLSACIAYVGHVGTMRMEGVIQRASKDLYSNDDQTKYFGGQR